MEHAAGKNSAGAKLYPPIEPWDRRMLDVGDGHSVYVEQCGAEDGIPVIVFHGGPGGGCSPAMRRFFNPQRYRIILFDQRGCGRSRPHASVTYNTTWHLIEDIELIRTTLGIDRWIVFGGSWGATLALIYAQTHPGRAAWLVLRGVFLATEREFDWFYGGGAGQFWPDLWARFKEPIPENEHGNLIEAYHQRLFSGNRAEELKHARIWAAWENALASIENDGAMIDSPADYALAFARLENHYFQNRAFLSDEQQILSNMGRIAHIPSTIVQGRHDMICPPQSAWALHQAWPTSEFRMIPRAGHAVSEPGIAAELVRTTDKLSRQRATLGL
ncbi:prolyl aminopeptidase [Maritimibacter dapengensis]|uniref:Proline iminopeptidase n=1 Tax=Maritimibacter dapengensis TaxID=2836868 RepID=A0ABS6T4D0_9RHOB|nr:prolyl aminopeptidase [Maritimibacter dapengensis]MBV7380104.1 prolyl aminopeptidase [Maritimibacter dapengensis]